MMNTVIILYKYSSYLILTEERSYCYIRVLKKEEEIKDNTIEIIFFPSFNLTQCSYCH